jgi:hypothetical protein
MSGIYNNMLKVTHGLFGNPTFYSYIYGVVIDKLNK